MHRARRVVAHEADVAVVGLGIMGACAAWRLAGRGARVVGFDRFRPPHAEGSSHGGSRIFRELAFEGARYVPLVRRAYSLWEELAAEARQPGLLLRTGLVYIGAPRSSVIAGSRASDEALSVAGELLSAEEARSRWPLFNVSAGAVALYEQRAGILRPEACVAAALRRAEHYGAELHLDEPVVEWGAAHGSAWVKTARRRVEAGTLVLATGPWLLGELRALGVAAWVERVVQHYFAPAAPEEQLSPDRLPPYICEDDDGVVFYGFPLLDGLLKCAVHHRGDSATIEDLNRTVGAAEIALVRGYLDRFLPDAAGSHERSVVCAYTNTPDGDFLLDRHPEHPEVILASPCCGIGFKFAPAIGEAIAGLALGGRPDPILAPFRYLRLQQRRV